MKTLSIKFFIILFAINFLFSQQFTKSNHIGKLQSLGAEEYYTDDAGNVFIYINIMGHVKSPGTYLVSEGSDFMTILAQSGGPLPGAKLNNTIVYHKKSGMEVINLEDYLNTGEVLDVKMYPNDTIYIEQTWGSYLFSNSSLINSMLQVMNIYLTITKQ